MATESNEAAYLPPPSVKDLGEGDGDVEHVEKDIKTVVAAVTDRPVHEMYLEAMERYPNDEAIDQAAEKRLLRKLDMRILPLLGICYFFYVSLQNMQTPFRMKDTNLGVSTSTKPHCHMPPSSASRRT